MPRLRDVLAWLVVATALLGTRIWFLGVNIEDDSYQYLSIANNIVNGNGISTSIPFYETELRHGVIPAPSTHFPPGYSLLIAFLQELGLRDDVAGYAVSFLAFAALAPLFLLLARQMGIRSQTARCALLMLCLNQALLGAASTLVSELAFTAATLAALLFVHTSQLLGRGFLASRSAMAAVAGGILAACAYWIRYAGLLFVATLALLCVVRLIQRRRSQLARAIISFGSAGVCIAPLLLRNQRLVGSWRGYNTQPGFHPGGVAEVYVVGMYHLFFGWGLARYVAPFAAVCLMCAIVLGVIAVRRKRRGFGVSLWVPALFAAVYTAGMIYLGITSDIGFGTRMFIPLLPVLLLLGAAFLTRWQPVSGHRSVIVLVAILLISYAAGNLIGISSTKTEARYLTIRAAVSGEVQAILDRDQSVLVSSDAQATSYGLGRPVVGLVGHEYASVLWTEQDVRDLLLRYRACHVLLFPGLNTQDGQETSPFLRSLAAGRHPYWLVPQAETDHAILYAAGCQ